VNLDITSLGIFLGTIGSIIFGVLEFRRRHQVLAGVELISAAFAGDPNNLPSAWREYLAVAGMVGIGLSLNFVVQALKKVLSIQVKAGDNASK